MQTLSLVLAGVFGLILGSFFNVCIYRIPQNKSIVWPGSFCPKCNNHIRWYDNIPVLSFLFLRGKCRHCKAPISWQYPLVELLTGLLTVLFVWKYGLSIWTFVLLTAVYFLIILSVIDLQLMIIPDRFSLGMIVLGVAFAWCNPNFSGLWWEKELASLLGAGVGLFGVLAIALIGTWLFKKEAMGGGDVKLMAGIGSLIGWQGVITTVVMGSFFGLVYALFVMIRRGKQVNEAIPFGPFLSLGALVNFWCLITPSMMVIEF
ncbi:MAG: prepilin peptidase [Elusimicrobiaceae bacterium]|nr:prepilin peptidase [Elusimicrobiaceae bacterium]MBP5617445.1 prepilin peptidase [Elusimicrobiaceae bacterium]